MKRQAVEGEGENSLANKGILSAPEAACATTSIPPTPLLPHLPPLFPTSLVLSGFIILCLYQLGLLNGPQLLNFMPTVNLVTLIVAPELH